MCLFQVLAISIRMNIKPSLSHRLTKTRKHAEGHWREWEADESKLKLSKQGDSALVGTEWMRAG